MSRAEIIRAIHALRIETPSWGYGNSGTRFKVFAQPGAARTLYEKIDDAALVHRLTGACPTVAIHIPWDRVDDWTPVRAYARERGIAIGAVNPNVFQDDEYRFGSVCHRDPAVRKRAVAHMLECVQIARTVESGALSLWLADGTNYPGQDDMRSRRARLIESLAEVYAAMPDGMRMLIEYKFFEPAFYHTDLADWGMAHLLACKLGPRAQVLVDTGHHPQGTNIEQIVALLIDEGRLGGFHFNNRKYADDDLMVGSVNPYELFLIFHEILGAGRDPRCAATVQDIAYMLDQSHNVEPKIEAAIQSVLNVQSAYAKALLVDRDALAAAQAQDDVLGANRILHDAFETDVRPLLADARTAIGAAADPITAFRASGYAARIARERGTAPTGGGYTG
ncbi:MAG: L-rhamnose isomerase [Chloroflexi bacterium]|nr:L-rhamnose isomerase [Chloroflexota bacterium]